jgi:hypothetical protein
MYLIRAECFEREGNKEKALLDLNTLLKQRWQTGTFIPFTANSNDDVLTLILGERRKELTCRNMRWFDIRRLNAEGKYTITLTRIENGQTFSLPPNDPRYTFLIPPAVIFISGIAQNSRK